MKAFPLVLAQVPDAHLLIIGDGILRENLEAEARAGGFADRVHFAGLISPDKVPDYLIQADILWHLSLREGLPRSVVQALACGIPACGYQLDGTPEVILNGVTGCCVPPRQLEVIARETAELLQTPEARTKLGAAGRELVRERFDKDRMAEILLRDYLNVLKRKQLM